jgi:hypothetical protein
VEAAWPSTSRRRGKHDIGSRLKAQKRDGHDEGFNKEDEEDGEDGKDYRTVHEMDATRAQEGDRRPERQAEKVRDDLRLMT